MVQRAATRDFGGVYIRLPTPEDLIIIKAVAGRARDFEDISALVLAHSTALDRKRIEVWVKSFAETLETPERWEEISALLGP
jgi:predicted nucleotidyltransferase